MNDYKQSQTPSDQKAYSHGCCVHGTSLKVSCMKCHYQVGKRCRLLHIPFMSANDDWKT